jgi:cold shock protein
MFRGQVKRWLNGKGYGFLIPDDRSPDLFCHVSAIVGGVELTPGDKVSFRIASDRKTGRPIAVDVQVIG